MDHLEDGGAPWARGRGGVAYGRGAGGRDADGREADGREADGFEVGRVEGDGPDAAAFDADGFDADGFAVGADRGHGRHGSAEAIPEELFHDEAFDEGEDPAPRPRAMERAAGVLGALTSAGLVLGLGVWTWDLAMRDLTAVPVVRALEGPVRTAPEDPGGDVAEHQGLAVNAIQAASEEDAGAAPAAPARLVLAPSEPDLAADDRVAPKPASPVVGIGPRPDSGIILLASADSAVAPPPPGGDARIDARPAPTDPIQAALAEALGMLPPDIEPEPEPAATQADAEAPGAPAAALVRSPRPATRPDLGAGIVPAALEAAPVAPTGGAVLVQLGTFASQAQAQAHWGELAARHEPYLAGKAPVVERASSAGRAFWRLRASGFEDASEARRHCAALEAEGAPCVPVTSR